MKLLVRVWSLLLLVLLGSCCLKLQIDNTCCHGNYATPQIVDGDGGNERAPTLPSITSIPAERIRSCPPEFTYSCDKKSKNILAINDHPARTFSKCGLDPARYMIQHSENFDWLKTTYHPIDPIVGESVTIMFDISRQSENPISAVQLSFENTGNSSYGVIDQSFETTQFLLNEVVQHECFCHEITIENDEPIHYRLITNPGENDSRIIERTIHPKRSNLYGLPELLVHNPSRSCTKESFDVCLIGDFNSYAGDQEEFLKDATEFIYAGFLENNAVQIDPDRWNFYYDPIQRDVTAMRNGNDLPRYSGLYFIVLHTDPQWDDWTHNLGSFSFAEVGKGRIGTLMHEVGHLIFCLGDEYKAPDLDRKKVNVFSSATDCTEQHDLCCLESPPGEDAFYLPECNENMGVKCIMYDDRDCNMNSFHSACLGAVKDYYNSFLTEGCSGYESHAIEAYIYRFEYQVDSVIFVSQTSGFLFPEEKASEDGCKDVNVNFIGLSDSKILFNRTYRGIEHPRVYRSRSSSGSHKNNIRDKAFFEIFIPKEEAIFDAMEDSEVSQILIQFEELIDLPDRPAFAKDKFTLPLAQPD